MSTKISTAYELIRELIATARTCEEVLVPGEELTIKQFHILDRLSQAPDGKLPQEALVSAAETAKDAGVSMLLKRMEFPPVKDGQPTRPPWIRRELNPNNRRKMIVELLPEGRRIWQAAREEYEKILKQRLREFRVEQIEHLAEVLSALRSSLREEPVK